MSRELTDEDIKAITILLSPERLETLKNLTGSYRSAIELHQQTLNLGAGLINVVASVELALRNTVCENLTIFFGSPGWLTHPPAPFQWKKTENQLSQKAFDSARRSTYAKMTQEEKSALDVKAFPQGRHPETSHLKRTIQRRKQIAVSNGKVIAETTFYFWKRLYSADYEQSLWRPTLKHTFPNKKTKRAQVAERLEYIYQARNRLAHHEPVLYKRFQDTMISIEFVCENMGVPIPSKETPLAKLIAFDLFQVKEEARKLHEWLASFRAPGFVIG